MLHLHRFISVLATQKKYTIGSNNDALKTREVKKLIIESKHSQSPEHLITTIAKINTLKDFSQSITNAPLFFRLATAYTTKGEYISSHTCCATAINIVRHFAHSDQPLSTLPQLPLSTSENAPLLSKILHLMAENQKHIIRNYQKQKAFSIFKKKYKAPTIETYTKEINRDLQELHTLRNDVHTTISSTPWLNETVELMAKEIKSKINTLLQRFITESIHALGKPPCHFEMIGFGSYAMESFTPYSDLELGILVEENGHLLYFLALSSLIQLRVISLMETRIRGSRTDMPEFDLHFPTMRKQGLLFDPTPKGITFDPGGKTPQGKKGHYQLIKTPIEMAAFVATQVTPNEVHLPDIDEEHLLGLVLQSSDLIYSSQTQTPLIRSFHTHVNEQLSSGNPSLGKQRALQLFEGDLQRYEPQLESPSKSGALLSSKQEVYRIGSTLITSLALYFGCSSGTIWDKLTFLSDTSTHPKSPKLFTADVHKNIKRALLTASEFRLRTYMHHSEQKETSFVSDTEQMSSEDSLSVFMINDEQPIFEFYYVIIPFLEACHLILSNDRYGEADPLYAYLDPVKAFKSFLTITKCYDPSQLHKGLIYMRLGRPKQAADCFLGYIQDGQITDVVNNISTLNQLGLAFMSTGDLNNAAICYEKIVSNSSFEASPKTVAIILNNYGECLLESSKFDQATFYLEEALKSGHLHQHTEINMAIAHNLNLLRLKTNQQLALGLIQAKAIHDWAQKNLDKKNPALAKYIGTLAHFHMKNRHYNESIVRYHECLTIQNDVLASNHNDLAQTHSNLGACYLYSGKRLLAAKHFQKSLTIRRNRPESELNTLAIAESLHNLGSLYSDQKGRAYYILAIEIRKRHIPNSVELAASYHSLARNYDHHSHKAEAKKYADLAAETVVRAGGDLDLAQMMIQYSISLLS